MSGNLYFLFLLFKNMDSIDRILNFINSSEEPEPETESEQVTLDLEMEEEKSNDFV